MGDGVRDDVLKVRDVSMSRLEAAATVLCIRTFCLPEYCEVIHNKHCTADGEQRRSLTLMGDVAFRASRWCSGFTSRMRSEGMRKRYPGRPGPLGHRL